jgi:type I restriction enzyme S subunit
MIHSIAVGNIVDHKKGFAFKSKDYAANGVPLIKVSDFDKNTVGTYSTYLSENISSNYLDWTVKTDDVLIATVGSWASNPNSVVGKVVRVLEAVSGAYLNQNCVRLRTKNSYSQRFLFYVLKSNEFQQHCLNSAQGSANQASITLDDIKRFEIPNHPYAIQQSIAHILGTLDDKIELNQKMNQTLEDIVKAIFKSWFVDFDPVRAKVEGKPTGLPDEISDLFPSEFVDSELGKIPRGWTISNLKTIVSKISEKFSAKESWKDEKLIDLSRMQSNSLSIYEYGIGAELSTSVCKFKKYDFLFGSIRPYFKKAVIAPLDGVTNTSVFVIRAKSVSDNTYLYAHASSDEVFSKSIQFSKGTKMPIISWEDFSSFQFVLPTEHLRKAYHELTIIFFEKMLTNIEENLVLSNIRDTLLPRLISGELQIPDAEKFLEEVGI